MKGTLKRNLAFLLSVVLVCTAIYNHHFSVRADENRDYVTGIEYVENDKGQLVGHVSGDDSISGNEGGTAQVTVPEGYALEVTGPVRVQSITVSGGATLVICGDGRVDCALMAEDGAFLILESAANVPEDVTLYEGEEEIGDDSIHWTFLEYIDGSWMIPFVPSFRVNFDGFDPESDSVRVGYKYTDEADFRNADVQPEFDEGSVDSFFVQFELTEIPEEWDNHVIVTVALQSERGVVMACADSGNDQGGIDLSAGISDEGTVFTYDFSYDDYNWAGIALAYPDSGNPAIVDEANNHLYAYHASDADGVKALFAEELICRLMDPSLFEYFGMAETNEENRAENVAELLTRIEESGNEYQITAKDPNGADHTIAVQDYKVNWGLNSEDGTPVESTIPVYTLENADQVLICTDFNDVTGRGSQFLICNIENDVVEISEGNEDAAWGVRFLVDSIQPATIKTGGMGRIETILNDEGLFTIEVNGGAPASYLRVTDPVHGAERIRLLVASEKYLAVGGSGETKAYGLIGDNGKNIDSVWATGDDVNAVARVYVGDSTIHLYPLNDGAGVTGTDVLSVELADPTQVDGVRLDASNPADVKLTFTSNFYDEIPLKITFEGGVTKFITILRMGLVIQYQHLGGSPNEPEENHGEIIQDYYGHSIPYTYNYFRGEQIVVYATYYHPTNDPTGGASDYALYLTFDDGTHRILTADDAAHNFNGRLPATNDKVASTTFLIGFEQARERFDGNVWIGQLTETDYHEGGFYATVLNAGFNDDTTYSGTQMGSGKGLYWDGHITFYR